MDGRAWGDKKVRVMACGEEETFLGHGGNVELKLGHGGKKLYKILLETVRLSFILLQSNLVIITFSFKLYNTYYDSDFYWINLLG
jgi:hypothetical protein